MINAEMKRFNLTHPMHCYLMGTFLDLRCSIGGKYQATKDALIARGLLDETGVRNELAMQYIQEHCNKRDAGMLTRAGEPLPMIYDDFGLVRAFLELDEGDQAVATILVDCGHTPSLAMDFKGNGRVALLSSRYMWDIEVARNKKHMFLNRYSINGHKLSYGYSIARNNLRVITDQMGEVSVSS